MDNEYYILDKGQKLGPFTAHELMKRPLEPNDIVLLPLQNQGVPAHGMPEFEDYFALEGIYYPTPENTSSYFLRFPAAIIDFLIINMGFGTIFSLLAPRYVASLQNTFSMKSFSDPNWLVNVDKHRTELIIFQIVSFVLTVFYNAFCESSKLRASVGKHLFGLAVVDESGYSIGFGQALARNSGKIIYEIAGFVISFVAYFAYLRMIWTDRHQAFHDQFSGCYIVKKNI